MTAWGERVPAALQSSLPLMQLGQRAQSLRELPPLLRRGKRPRGSLEEPRQRPSLRRSALHPTAKKQAQQSAHLTEAGVHK